jgi:RNA polymerase sigma-70 factor (ECF subfamily)
MSLRVDDTENLIGRAAAGESAAREELLTRYRERLRRAIALRLDPRLVARVDASDVVQEVMAEAAGKLSEYLQHQPLPFYAWLRQLALERLVQLHRRHVRAEKRSVVREEPGSPEVAYEARLELADRLLGAGGTPLAAVLRDELRRRVHEVLGRLPALDREVLVLRHLEQLSTRESAAALGVTEGAVKTRHLRALRRFRELMNGAIEEKTA